MNSKWIHQEPPPAMPQRPKRLNDEDRCLFICPKDLRAQLDALSARDNEPLAVVIRRLLRRGLRGELRPTRG
jgi:hypothetical protein